LRELEAGVDEVLTASSSASSETLKDNAKEEEGAIVMTKEIADRAREIAAADEEDRAAAAAEKAADAEKATEKPTESTDVAQDAAPRQAHNPLSDEEEEKQIYTSEHDSKIYVYIASDNNLVKEAMALYLRDHADIAVMRVKNNAEIAHAKNVQYLKKVGNHTGVIDMTMDWYALSLANVVFAWRKGTNLISTFAHRYVCMCVCVYVCTCMSLPLCLTPTSLTLLPSFHLCSLSHTHAHTHTHTHTHTHSAQRLSGNTEKSDNKHGIGHGIGSRGLSLYYGKNGVPQWRYFY
jgi:hypothetical protein